MRDEFAVITGRLPRDLANTTSDAIYDATQNGMEVDEAVCVVLAVAADYGRSAFGDGYLEKMCNVLRAQRGREIGGEPT